MARFIQVTVDREIVLCAHRWREVNGRDVPASRARGDPAGGLTLERCQHGVGIRIHLPPGRIATVSRIERERRLSSVLARIASSSPRSVWKRRPNHGASSALEGGANVTRSCSKASGRSHSEPSRRYSVMDPWDAAAFSGPARSEPTAGCHATRSAAWHAVLAGGLSG